MSAALPLRPRPRLLWIDLYRGLAVLLMIETHVANTFLAPSLQAAPWYGRLTYLNGLVAPAFLFIAGLAQGLSRHRQRARSHSLRPRLVRLGGIAALGYALHFPWAELSRGEWNEALRQGSRMDVLPCLAAAMVVIVLAERFTGNKAGWVIGALAAAILVLAPALAGWSGGSLLATAMVNTSTGSLFPLLPWMSFAFCGYLVSSLLPHFRNFAWPVLVAFGASLVLPHGGLASANPAFFFERLAWIFALVPICGWMQHRWAAPMILAAGRESLVIYVVHLFLISWLAAAGLPTLGSMATAALLAAVLAGAFGASSAWRRWRNPL